VDDSDFFLDYCRRTYGRTVGTDRAKDDPLRLLTTVVEQNGRVVAAFMVKHDAEIWVREMRDLVPHLRFAFRIRDRA
jgi:hypothetical protein